MPLVHALRSTSTHTTHLCASLPAAQQDANKYIDEQAPWKLRKAGPEGEARAATVLWTLLEAIRRIAILYQPVVPLGATRMLDQLQVPADDAARSFEVRHTCLTASCTVTVVCIFNA
jgi:methionyl-tRNA synthetase